MSTAQTNHKGIVKIIGASSLGALIEWYDFYIFGSLAVIIGRQLFPADAGASALINTLAIFAAGFIVRPFGALLFGSIGDKAGRKYTFLLTLVLMGGSTFLIGLIPSYASIGYGAPLLVLLLRLIQGLALGGEYGGAATYVAEHAPHGRRGFYTSWIQTTATLGLFLSIAVIVGTKSVVGGESFAAWGWRIPFLLSVVLVLVSIYIRLKMHESPLFSRLKAGGGVSLNPLKESFRNKANFKLVLLALFGATMGQGVVWYTGQFYAQSFLENTVKLAFNESRYIILWAILFATPFFVLFGWMSDKIGRKWIMLSGMLLGVICYRPIYQKFMQYRELIVYDKDAGVLTAPITQSMPIKNSRDSLRLISTRYSNAYGTQFTRVETDTTFYPARPALSIPTVQVTEIVLQPGWFRLFVFLVFIQVLFVTMVYGPIAAFLVELFPTRIRYTSMSLPYHVGNGVFGGLVPFIATLMTNFKGASALSGLWYPIGIAALSLIIGCIFISNKNSNQEPS